MEDIRVMRRTKFNQLPIAVTVAGVVALPANPNRVHLLVSSPVTNTLFVSFLSNPVAGQGIKVGVNHDAHHFDLQSDGILVTSSVFLSILVAPETVTIIETILEEK